MEKVYYVDLCTLAVTAENEEQAKDEAIRMIKEGGFVCIDQVIEAGEVK